MINCDQFPGISLHFLRICNFKFLEPAQRFTDYKKVCANVGCYPRIGLCNVDNFGNCKVLTAAALHSNAKLVRHVLFINTFSTFFFFLFLTIIHDHNIRPLATIYG